MIHDIKGHGQYTELEDGDNFEVNITDMSGQNVNQDTLVRDINFEKSNKNKVDTFKHYKDNQISDLKEKLV